ncbi:MAG: adenylate/guanylate cyclase domain-containing protein [Mariprofundaceae bacterium]|nr:adenylate/guanylate cyclase domain-containing protein [Mariprofundaceae bacterium]
MPEPDTHIQQNIEQEETPPRFPIRWRWTMLVSLTISVAVFAVSLIILDMERNAWLDSQSAQAQVMVERLGDELKLPMLAGSKVEVDVIVSSFLQKVPAVLGAHIEYADGEDQHYGNISVDDPLLHKMTAKNKTMRLPVKHLWFVKKIEYAGTEVGIIAVRYSEKAWEELASRLVTRMILISIVVITLASFAVYWIAGRMSKPIEALASAAEHVAFGDYSIRLPLTGNDEITDATNQFNNMVGELAHKEEIRDIFGRYLNPKLVAEVFDEGVTQSKNTRQEVTVLFADMVSFTSFSESTSTEEVVDVLNQHFEVFHRIIDYYGGHVDKYIGDAVMAVFNHPHEDTQHARHAAKAGLAMTKACSKLGILRQSGEPVAFRIGINSGQVIVGNIGAAERLEYTVIGNAVNMASRMGGIGEANEIMLTRSTFNALGTGFEFNSIGEKSIKGIRQPVECGSIKATDGKIQTNIGHAIALAFDLTLPSDVRQIVGEI